MIVPFKPHLDRKFQDAIVRDQKTRDCLPCTQSVYHDRIVGHEAARDEYEASYRSMKAPWRMQ